MKDDGRISENRKTACTLGLVVIVVGGLACFGAVAYGMISAASFRS